MTLFAPATFFVLLLGTAVIGAWLVAAGRRSAATDLAVHQAA